MSRMSLLYFWAGEFKARVSWLDGTTLYKDIEILDTPLDSQQRCCCSDTPTKSRLGLRSPSVARQELSGPVRGN